MIVGRRLKTWSLLALVNLFWAAQYPAYRIVGETMGSATLNFWTFVIAVGVLLFALMMQRKRGTVGVPKRRPSGVLAFIWLALLGLIPPSVVLAWGISHSSASNASILSLTIPVLMVVMAMLILKERPGRFLILSLCLALVGMILISWDDVVSGNFSGGMLVGNVAVFLGGAGAAFYNTYCKILLSRYSAVEVLVYGYLAAIVLCGAISIAVDPVPFYHVTAWTWPAWLAIAVLGGIVWGAAMLIWMWLLDKLELGQISVSVYMLPVFGVLLSAVTLGGPVGLLQLLPRAILPFSTYLF